MNKQKLCTGDLVLIPKFYPLEDEYDFDPFRRYRGKQAVVDAISTSGSVSLKHEDGNGNAWWSMSELVFLEPECYDLIEIWAQKRKEYDDIVGDLDWIFGIPRHREWVPPDASIKRLFSELTGSRDIWGSRGEGFMAASNAMRTIGHARRFLSTGDRDGFIAYAKDLRSRIAKFNKATTE